MLNLKNFSSDERGTQEWQWLKEKFLHEFEMDGTPSVKMKIKLQDRFLTQKLRSDDVNASAMIILTKNDVYLACH